MGDGGGVLVDEFTQTSAEGVYAIGDLANFPSAKYGKRFRLEHVRCARAMAEQCAKVIAGNINGNPCTEGFEYLPNFYSRVLNFSWEFFGLAEGDFKMIVEKDADSTRILGVFRQGTQVQ